MRSSVILFIQKDIPPEQGLKPERAVIVGIFAVIQKDIPPEQGLKRYDSLNAFGRQP